MTFNGVENLNLEIPSSGMLLFGLSIDTLAEMKNQHHFTVNFEDAVGDGFTLNFKCRQIEVLEVERCDSRGERYKP